MAAESHYEMAVDALTDAERGKPDPIEVAKVHALLELGNAVREVREEIRSLKIRIG